MKLKRRLQRSGYFLNRGTVLCILFATYRAESFQSTLGFQLHQGQTDLTTLSTDAVTGYSGPAYIGELTLNFYDSDLTMKSNSPQSAQPGLNVFFFGGSSKENNTANAIGDVKTNQILGAGADLRIRRFFVGSFAQSNNSTITTSSATTSFSYTTIGIRTGFEFSVSGSEDTTKLQIGAIYEVGRSPVTPIGSWYVASTSFFVGIKFRVWKTASSSGN